MKVAITVRAPDFSRIGRQLREAMEAELSEMADETPELICASLRRGVGPSGRAQPRLDPDTVEDKRRRGKPSHLPGVDQGILSSPQRWQTRQLARLRWQVTPPPERAKVVYYLQTDHGYDIVSWPTKGTRKLQVRLRRALRRAFRGGRPRRVR